MAVIAQERPTARVIPAELARGAVGGLIAGALFILVTMWFAESTGGEAKGPLMMISSIVLGKTAMADGTASVGTGIAVHAVLSVVFGVVFGFIASRLRTNGSVLVAGTAYGALLYVTNFLVFAPVAFPLLKMANQPFELVVHIVFGTVLALFFLSTGPRSGEPVLALTRD